jgi:CheY-like chemotaxis protein
MDEPVRILVVDDSATIRTALQLILAPTPYAVEFACSGAEAIAQAEQAPPAMILLDFILPDMRGTEVCRALLASERARAVPVVLVSARGAEIRQAYQDVDNVVAYLTKPFTPEQVHEVIEEVLARRGGDATAAALPAPPAPEVAPESAPATEFEAAAAWPAEDESDDELDAEPAAAPRPAAQRAALDAMFETLRAGLEGVHVEEAETGGSAAEQARSFAELASQVARQLEETLAHATSGARYSLCGDGSIRSLEEALLDAHRRVCRLVFRSVSGGMAQAAPDAPRPRVLLVGRPDGAAAEAVEAAASAAGWHLFRITSGFAQLPVMTRLYAPSHLVVDLCGPTVWQELATLRQMSESRRLHLLGVVDAGGAAPDAAQLAARGIDDVLVAGPRLADAIHRWLAGGEPPAASAEVPASAAA